MPSDLFVPNDVGNQLVVVGPLRPGVDNSFAIEILHWNPVTKQSEGPYDFTGWNPGEFHIGTDDPKSAGYQALVSVPYSFAADRTSGVIELTVTFRHMYFVIFSGLVQGGGGFDGYSPQGNLTAITDAVWYQKNWSN